MKSFSIILLSIVLAATAVSATASVYSKVAAPAPAAVQAATFSDDKMLINTPFKGEQTVTVTDHNGTQIGSFKAEAQHGAVTIPAVASTGAPVIYQVTLKDADGTVVTKKVLVF